MSKFSTVSVFLEEYARAEKRWSRGVVQVRSDVADTSFILVTLEEIGLCLYI